VTAEPTPTCPNCGAAVIPGAAFCPTCGTSLSGQASPAGGQPPPQMPSYGGPPQPVSEQDSKNWAMGAHLSAIAGAMLGGLPAFVGPLVVWLVRKPMDPFAAEHGREALNFNLTVLLVVIAGVLLGVFTLGIGFFIVVPVLAILGILWLVWTIQATIAASNGQAYRYPMTIRFVTG
jgi:uncharacterized protein